MSIFDTFMWFILSVSAYQIPSSIWRVYKAFCTPGDSDSNFGFKVCDSPIRATLIAIPALVQQGLMWPIEWILDAIPRAKVGYNAGKRKLNLKSEIKKFYEKKLIKDRIYHDALKTIGVFLIAVLFSLRNEMITTPLVIWMGGLWLSLVLQIASFLVPPYSLSTLLRTNPESIPATVCAYFILYAIVLPMTSSLLTLFIEDERITAAGILTQMITVYSFGGIFWEGVKAAVPRIINQQGNVLQWVTSFVLYFLAGAKIIQSFIIKPSEADYYNAAERYLILGAPQSASPYIQKLSSTSDEYWLLRITHAMMIGNVSKAVEMAKTKISIFENYARRKELTAVVTLTILAARWNFPDKSKEDLWQYFIACTPAEEELFILFIVNSNALFFDDTRFLECAVIHKFDHFQMFVHSSTNASMSFKEKLRHCENLCPASFFVEALSIGIVHLYDCKNGGPFGREDANRMLKTISTARLSAQYISEIVLVIEAFSALLVACYFKRETPGFDFNNDLQAELMAIQDRLDVMPGGIFFVQSILSRLSQEPVFNHFGLNATTLR